MWVEINPKPLLLLRRELLDGFEDLLISEFNLRHELVSLSDNTRTGRLPQR